MQLRKTFENLVVIFVLNMLFPLFVNAQNENGNKITHKNRDSLKQELSKMLNDDQTYRWMITFGELDSAKVNEYLNMDIDRQMQRMLAVQKKHIGISKKQRDSLMLFQKRLDSVNFIKLHSLIVQFGFPSKLMNPADVNTILLHSTNQIDDQFMILLLNEVRSGHMPGREYALLYDQVQIDKMLPEKYYVIEHYDALTGTYKVNVPVDYTLTNKDRADIGLKSLR